MQDKNEEYMSIERVNAVRERSSKLRRQYLKYKDAEIVYSLTHRKLLDMADQMVMALGKRLENIKGKKVFVICIVM